MALSPFDPTPDQSVPQAPQGAGNTTDLAGGWRDWINRPNNQAALMQFGIAMMQPIGIGETPLSHAASAVGSGGEAAARVTKQGLAEREASSREELRAAQAGLAGARAETAGARSDAAANRLDTARERLAFQQQNADTNQRIRALLGYQQYQKGMADRNTRNALIGGQPEPILPFEDWAAQSGLYFGRGGGGAPQVDPADVDRVRAALAADPNDPKAQQAAQVLRARGVQL